MPAAKLDTMTNDLDTPKSDRKEKLKEEAEKLGIPYKELKAQKKEQKHRNKRDRESDRLESSEHKAELNRLRSYSKDGDADDQATKRRRTRSMDAKEEEEAKSSSDINEDPVAWRKEHSITIRGHGKHQSDTSFPDPFFAFTQAPFCEAIQRTFTTAGFSKPTAIQSQVSNHIQSIFSDISLVFYRKILIPNTSVTTFYSCDYSMIYLCLLKFPV